MSVYSGFATRQQQKRYNDYLDMAFSILAKRIVKFYSAEPCDQQKFQNHLLQIHDKMVRLQQSKYMQPHYSHALRALLLDIESFQSRSRVKEDVQVHFDAEPEHSQVKQKARFNSMEHMVKQFQEIYDKESLSKRSFQTLQEPQYQFRSRIKTYTPEKKIKEYATPQQPRTPQQLHDKIVDKQHIFKRQLKESPYGKEERPVVPRLDQPVNNRQKHPVSPRQFLRQTIIGKQGESNPILFLRNKQKYNRKTKS